MEHRTSFVLLLIFVLFLSCVESLAVFRFANVYGDHMVLQKAPLRATIWGYGEVGQEVKLIFNGRMFGSIIAQGRNKTGIWSVVLTPTKFGGPYTITAYSVVNKTKVSASLQDVLFGDVWVCSGQSNMEFPVVSSFKGAQAINESVNYKNIRIFIAAEVTSDVPLSELKEISLPWSIPSSERGKVAALQHFSAVCWYYAVQLYNKLEYPIGLVESSFGGTIIEAWSSPDALKQCNITTGEQPPSYEERNRMQDAIAGPNVPSYLWNGMIYPFLNMTMYGVIWYQGEENAIRNVHPYDCTFPAMIDDWRIKWYESTQHNTEEFFPFGFVQLSAVGTTITGQKENFAPLRWNQTARFGYAPNAREKGVFMAVAMDLAEPYSPYGSIHPRDKTDVGIRLARAGLAIAYNQYLYYSGPLLSEIKKQRLYSSSALEVIYKSVSRNIEVRSQAGFEVLCKGSSSWTDAPISDIGSMSVIIKPSKVCEVEAVRYAWSDYPCFTKQCAIYSDDLPGPPFIKYGAF